MSIWSSVMFSGTITVPTLGTTTVSTGGVLFSLPPAPPAAAPPEPPVPPVPPAPPALAAAAASAAAAPAEAK